MGKIYNIRTFALVFILFGIYALLFSESGLLERISLQRKKADLEKKLGMLKYENDELTAAYELYRKGGLKKNDIMKAGYVGKGEKVIFFKGGGEVGTDKGLPEAQYERNSIPLRDIRIIWAVVSLIVLIFYFSRKSVPAGAD